MKLKIPALIVAIGLVAVATSQAFAQGSFFTSLSVTVVDSSGLPIPGANI